MPRPRPPRLSPSIVASIQPGAKQTFRADGEVEGLTLSVLPTGRKRWYYRYRFAGKQRAYLIGDALTITRSQAVRRVRSLAGEVAAGRDPVGELHAARKEREAARVRTLGAFIDAKYEPWVQTERKGGAEIVKRIRSNFGWLLGTPMDSINPFDVERWRSEKHGAGRAPGTTNRDLSTLRECLRKAVEWGVIDSNPLASVRRRRGDRRPPIRILSDSDELALRQALRDRDARMRSGRESANAWRVVREYEQLPMLGTFADHLEPVVLIALNTGMRRGEILGLRWDDVSEQEVTIRADNAKSATTRRVPLNREAREVFRRLPRDGQWVFPGPEPDQPLRSIKKSWASLKQAAGLDSVRFHDIRHTVASRLVRRADIRTVADILGHEDIATTARYLHTDEEAKRAALEALG